MRLECKNRPKPAKTLLSRLKPQHEGQARNSVQTGASTFGKLFIEDTSPIGEQVTNGVDKPFAATRHPAALSIQVKKNGHA